MNLYADAFTQIISFLIAWRVFDSFFENGTSWECLNEAILTHYIFF
jgi:hypothetical protein